MNEENMKEFHPELAEYYQKGDCCTWIVKLRKQVSEKDKEIERLNNIINECAEEILKELQENHHLSYGVALAIRQKIINYRELKESGNNE